MKTKKYSFIILIISILCSLSVLAQQPVKTPKVKKPTENTSKSSTNKGNKTSKTTTTTKKTPSTTKTSTPSSSSRPTSFAKGLNSWTAFTLNPNEIIDLQEYKSNLKLRGAKSVMLLTDTASGKQSLVVDGKRIVNNATRLQIYYVHPKTLDELVYMYAPSKNTEYMVIKGKQYGPYDMVGEVWGDGFYANYDHFSGVRFNEFIFRQMGKYFRHDADGTIDPITLIDKTYKPGFSNKIYRSSNGRYTLKVSDDGRTVTGGGKTVQLVPNSVPSNKIYYQTLIPYDDGRAIVKVGYYNSDNQWEIVRALLRNGVVKYGGRDEIFDLHKGELVSNSSAANNPYDIWTLEPKFNFRPVKKGSSYYTGKYEYSLQDPSKQHSFMGNWEYDYVLIDGQRYSTGSPIDAWYDDEEKAFVWTSLEGRQIKNHVYKF